MSFFLNLYPETDIRSKVIRIRFDNTVKVIYEKGKGKSSSLACRIRPSTEKVLT